MTRRRSEATKVLETIGNLRCPCGHLAERHRKPNADSLPGTVMEQCRDCECRGLIDWSDDD
jgi:hypothetical protein